MKLRKLLHPFHYGMLKYILSRDNKAVDKNSDNGRGRVFLLQAADYGNIGDIAITLAQIQRLESLFPDKELVVMRASSEYDDLKSLTRGLKSGDLITIVGGGSIGDVYYYYEIYRQIVVTLSRHIPIVIFPQSVRFRKLSNFKRAANIYGRKRELLFAAREEDSYRKLSCFNVRRTLLPDIVMTMDFFSDNPRRGAGVCLRDDRERLINDAERDFLGDCVTERFGSVSFFDTHCGHDNISPSHWQALLTKLLNHISEMELLITDRLHGMIFGFITGTPTIALSNNNPKIRESYKWIESCPYVSFIADVRDLPETLDKMSRIRVSYDDFRLCHDKILGMYEDFDNMVREFAENPNR